MLFLNITYIVKYNTCFLIINNFHKFVHLQKDRNIFTNTNQNVLKFHMQLAEQLPLNNGSRFPLTKVIKLRSNGIRWRNKKFRRLVAFLNIQITSQVITQP
jgi:hypothetical protein